MGTFLAQAFQDSAAIAGDAEALQRKAAESGFRVGLVSNAYWATSTEDAEIWLEPLVDAVEDLTLSSDLYHSGDPLSTEVRRARAAAQRLGHVDLVRVFPLLFVGGIEHHFVGTDCHLTAPLMVIITHS